MKEQNGSTSGRPMRRKERELTVDQAWEVVEGTDHAVLATVDDEGNPYGVPITPVAVIGRGFTSMRPENRAAGNQTT